MIKAIGEGWRGVPLLMMPGLVVFVVASAVDLAFHLAPPGRGEAMEAYIGSEGYLAHLGITVGMILTVLGLIAWSASVRRHRREERRGRVTRGL